MTRARNAPSQVAASADEALLISDFTRLVLPGRAPETSFGANARLRMQGTIPEAYAGLAQQVFAEWAQQTLVTQSQDVAEAVWRAANDPSCPVRLAAGADAVALAEPS